MSSLWDELAANELFPRDYRVTTAGHAVNSEEVLLAVDSNGYRHVLIPSSLDEQIESDTRSAGIHLVGRILIDADKKRQFVDVFCRKPALHSVFDFFIKDLFGRLSADASTPAFTARQTLARWRDLLARESFRGMTADELSGFFGELWWLEKLVAHNGDAVYFWKAPMGSPRDFQNLETDLEVKTSTGVDTWRVHINGIDQLDKHEARGLYLSVLAVRADAEDGSTIIGLIDRVAGLSSDPSEFYHRILQRGWTVENAERYGLSRYKVVHHRVFEVTSVFPRLVRSSFIGNALPERISNLRYELDLAGYSESLLSDSETDMFVERFAEKNGKNS